MKRIRLATALVLVLAVALSAVKIYAADKGYSNEIKTQLYKTAQEQNISYAGIEYNYSENVYCGTVRYIGQNASSCQYYSAYWGSHSPSSECLTANISMALSYVGSNVTPKQILDYSTNTVWRRLWGGITSYEELPFEDAMWKYINGGGKYSPPIIHLTGSYCGYSRGHYLLVVGKISDTEYQAIDTYCDPYNPPLKLISIVNGVVSYKLSAGARECWSPLSTAYQYYNQNAVLNQVTPSTDNSPVPETNITPDVIPEQNPTIGINPDTNINQKPKYAKINNAVTPKKIVEGSAFSIKGKIKSDTIITKVSVYVKNSSGKIIIKVQQKPQTQEFDLFSKMDNDVKFGTLTAGKYRYIVKAKNEAGEKTLISKSFIVSPKATKIVSLKNTKTGIKLKWNKSDNATGYVIYRSRGNKEPVKIATIKQSKKTSKKVYSYVDKQVGKNKKYTYKIYVYKKDKSAVIKSKGSKSKSIKRL